MHTYMDCMLQLNPITSRISLLLHEFKAEPRASVNSKDILATSVVGFNWLLPQCFDLLCFLPKKLLECI